MLKKKLKNAPRLCPGAHSGSGPNRSFSSKNSYTDDVLYVHLLLQHFEIWASFLDFGDLKIIMSKLAILITFFIKKKHI
jgi:hypothetical protein